MNYIYDILINFNEKLYDFYEWNINDEITHVRKIPLFKIDSKTLCDIKNNKVKIYSEVLEKIKNKTEVFTNKNIKNIDYACLLSDGSEVFAVTFDKAGISLYKSKLLVDEDYEVIEVCERVSESKVGYQIISAQRIEVFKTRKEIEMDYYIKMEIERLNYDNNLDKLRYLYYECFNEKEDDKDKIIEQLNVELKRNWRKIAEKLYSFFKLTSINK
jgi:hypothetical protein